jgi:hypothetical protein
MPITTPRVSFGLYGLVIKQDSIPSASDLQSFSKVQDLRTDNATNRPYATYEPNFWLLDGGYKFLPENTATVHVGMMSLAMSDNNGNFAVPPVLTVGFQQAHSTDGLALRFSQYTGDYASLLTVRFYDSTDALIREDTYAPTSWEFSTGQAVSNFKKVVITFQATNRPYRYLRLAGIDYGELIYFQGPEVQAAEAIEEMNVLSTEVPYGTLKLQLFSNDADFSMINPSGYFAALKERQPLAVHELVDQQSVFIGQYYLETWTNPSDNQIEFDCVDLLGVLDGMPYHGGLWLGDGIALHTLIETILEPIFIPYDLDIELFDVVVKGWLPASSYREALQQIAFAVGAYVTCARSSAVKIYKSKIAAQSSPTASISKSEKGIEAPLSLTTLVTGIEVTSHNYISSTDSKQLYNGTLTAGQHEITFSEPIHDLAVSGASIIESGVNYAMIQVPTTGTVVLSGQTYTDTTKVFSVSNSEISSSVKPNVLKIENATLVNASNVQEVTQRVYDYYQQRYVQKMKLFAPSAQVGDVALIDTLYDRQIRGVIEKMTTDLANGFIVDAEATGVIHEMD